MDDGLATFQQDSYVQELSKQGLSLRQVAFNIEQQVIQEQSDIVQEYLMQTNDLLDLNDVMHKMDDLMSDMRNTFSRYVDDIGRMNKDISSIQVESKAFDIKLMNRKEAFKVSGELLDGIFVSPDLIKKIAEAEINEFFVLNLQELDQKLNYAMAHRDSGILALNDSAPELERLRLKALDKVRDFFLKKIDSFKAPNTNIALIQQNVLLKYKELFWFLMDHYTDIGLEIHQTYIGYVNAYFLSSFERYYRAISHLQSSPIDKNDLIGIDEGSKRGLFSLPTMSVKSMKDSNNIFGLGDRLKTLTTDESGIIVPEHTTAKKYTYEAIFKSLTRLLIDNASSEFVFTTEFFNNPKNPVPFESLYSFFAQAFGSTLKFVEAVVRSYVDTSFDAIGLICCIRINAVHLRVMQKRRLPHMESFLNLINILLWPRFQTVMGMHIDSLRKADPKKLMSTKESGIHYVIRRYAEFSTSILILNQGYQDAMLFNSLSRLRTEMESLMYRLAAEFPDKKTALAFWINNVDLCLSTLNEYDIESFGPEKIHFEKLLDEKIVEYVMFQLTPHIGTLIDNIPRCEKDSSKVSKDVLEQIATEFNTNWRAAIEKIHEEQSKLFPNFKNGAKVFHATLTNLLLWYKRFLLVWDSSCKAQKMKIAPVGIQTLLVEIKKFRSNFS